jgi:hypothetical protein
VTSPPHNISSDKLQRLSDDVNRIAGALARLTTNATAPLPRSAVAADPIEISADAVRKVIRARRHRGRFFNAELFADPCWDMMLDLLEAEIAQRRVAVSSLCVGAAVPATTALRWLKSLVDQGLFVRRPDPCDGRRVFVELSPATSRGLREYFAQAAPPPGT